MQDRAGKITYGAMMIAMFAILLNMTVYIPLVGWLTLFIIPLPIVLYRLRYDRAESLLVLVGSVLLSMLIGGIIIFPIALIFAPIGFVMGDTMKQEKSKLYTFMASGLTILLTLMLIYVATVLLFAINVIDEMMKALRDSQEQMTAFMVRFGEVPENFEKQLEEMMMFYEVTIPSTFIIGSFGFAFIVVIINAAIARRLGHKPPKFAPFKDMKLPTATVWSYLVILLLPIMTTIEEGTTLYLTYVNASTILKLLLIVQGVSLIHYYMYEMKMPKWGTIISTIFAIILSPVTILLGILDSGMNLRAWIRRDKSN